MFNDLFAIQRDVAKSANVFERVPEARWWEQLSLHTPECIRDLLGGSLERGVHGCLSDHPSARPSFAEVVTVLRGAIERAVVAPLEGPRSRPLPMLDDKVGGGDSLTQRSASGLEDHGDAASFGAYSDFLPDGRRPWAVRGDSPLLSSHGRRAVHGLASASDAVGKETAATRRSAVRNDGLPAPLPGSLRRSLTSLTSSYVSEGTFADAAVEYDPCVWILLAVIAGVAC